MKNSLFGILIVLSTPAFAAGNFVSDAMNHGKTPYQALAAAFALGQPAQFGDFSTLAQTLSGTKRLLTLSNDVEPNTTADQLSVDNTYGVLVQNVQTVTTGTVPSAGPLFPGNPGVTTTTTNYVLVGLLTSSVNDSYYGSDTDAQMISSLGTSDLSSYVINFTPGKTYEEQTSSDGSKYQFEYRAYQGMIFSKGGTGKPGTIPTYNYYWSAN